MTSKILRTTIMGIDPGLTGALAIYDLKQNKILALHDIPTIRKSNGRRECDYYQCAAIIDVWAPTLMYAVVEDVHSMPNQGVVSMFSFGKVSGALEGMLASSMVKYHKVKPAVWKAQLGLSHRKEESLELAKKIFGSSFGKNDGQAEAALLAHWGRMVLGRGG